MKSITLIQRLIWIVITISHWIENNFCFNHKMFEYYIIFVKFFYILFFCSFCLFSVCLRDDYFHCLYFQSNKFPFSHNKNVFLYPNFKWIAHIFLWFIQIAFTFTLKWRIVFLAIAEVRRKIYIFKRKKRQIHTTTTKNTVLFSSLGWIASQRS